MTELSIDERFIIKQVANTELDSFSEFGPQYFQYLSDSLSSRSPTCLAKVLGIYQVTVKRKSGGKETKMDLMVMESPTYILMCDYGGCVSSQLMSWTTHYWWEWMRSGRNRS